MFVRKQVESKRVPMINIGTLFICYVLYPGFFKQTAYQLSGLKFLS